MVTYFFGVDLVILSPNRIFLGY